MVLLGNQSTYDGVVPAIKMQGNMSGRSVTMDSSSANTAMAFLVSELEKREPKLLEPLTSTTWPRDIAVSYGGGWLEFISSQYVQYGDAGSVPTNVNGLGSGQSTDVAAIQVQTAKRVFRVFTFLRKLHVPFVDQALLQTAGRSLDEMMTNGLHLSYDKTVDENVYIGFSPLGTYGILNNPDIPATTAPNGASGTATWSTKTPAEILKDINNIINTTWTQSEYDLQGMANHILIPPAQYAYLVSQVISDAGSQSILNYLLDNNIGRNQGVELSIFPCRWCIGAGTGGTDRMVAYANHRDNLDFDMTVPLQRLITQPSAEHIAFISAYGAQFSEVKIKREQTITYMDGI